MAKNTIQDIGTQLHQIWRQLGINQRVTLSLAASIVLIGMVAVVFWSSRGDYTLLYGKLPESEVARVVSALDEAKVPYRLSSGGSSVLVPASKVHSMRMQLATKGIPKGDGVGFEIFDKPNFGISDFIQRANYLRAVQGELARTISQVDPIESARVMVVMPENRLLIDQQKRPTASVFVKVRGNAPLPSQTVNAIRFLVANAVEGLSPNHVTVVDNLGNVLVENTDNQSLAGLSATQLNERKNLEQYLSRKAEDMLAVVLGPGQAVVRVAAEINFDTNTQTEEKFDPDVQVPRISTINDEDTQTTTGGSGGVAGVSTNASTETNMVAAANGGSRNLSKKKVTNNQYELNKTVNSIVRSAGGIKRLSAAVFVAARTEGSGAGQKLVPRSTEELDKLRRIVQSALGILEKDVARGDIVTLEEMPFNQQPAAELAKQAEQLEKRQFWQETAEKLFYPVVAVFICLVFWRLFRRTSKETSLLRESAEATASAVPLASPGFSRNPPVTIEVLNQLLKENPNNMTHAIRSWMERGPGKN